MAQNWDTAKLRDALIEALPKVGEPEDVWCTVHASTLRAALAALAQPAASGEAPCSRCHFPGGCKAHGSCRIEYDALQEVAAHPPVAPEPAEQTPLRYALDSLYAMGLDDGASPADDEETNAQRRAAAVNLTLGRIAKAQASGPVTALTDARIDAVLEREPVAMLDVRNAVTETRLLRGLRAICRAIESELRAPQTKEQARAEREASQRATLTQQLEGRKKPPFEAGDYGAPGLPREQT